jgi:hypothetical protein
MIVKLFTKRQPGNYKRNRRYLLTGCKHIVFRPVFNIADSSITIVVLLMILFQKQFCHLLGRLNLPAKEPRGNFSC